jgi:hypothetical protein
MCANSKPKRALSLRQAQNCENAIGEVCRCRCGGALHGIARAGKDKPPEREFFTTLPEGDPHYLPPKKKSADEKEEIAFQLKLFV